MDEARFRPPLPLFQEDRIERSFQKFHRSHPEVYAELKDLAFQAVERGYVRVGISLLWEVLRWNRMMRTHEGRPDDYKLNNNYRSRYARLLMENEPDLRGLFETRELRSR